MCFTIGQLEVRPSAFVDQHGTLLSPTICRQRSCYVKVISRCRDQPTDRRWSVSAKTPQKKTTRRFSHIHCTISDRTSLSRKRRQGRLFNRPPFHDNRPPHRVDRVGNHLDHDTEHSKKRTDHIVADDPVQFLLHVQWLDRSDRRSPDHFELADLFHR